MGIPIWKPYLNEEKARKRSFGIFDVTSIPLKGKNGEWCHTNNDGSECPVYAYLIECDNHRILYATDFLYIPYSFKAWNLDTMIIEAHHDVSELDEEAPNYYHTVLGHPDISVTKNFIKISQTDALRTVIIVHMSGVADVVNLKGIIKDTTGNAVKVEVAERGKEFFLGT